MRQKSTRASLRDIDSCEKCTNNEDCDEVCHPEMGEICFGETEPPPGGDDPTCENVESCIIDMMGTSECPAGHYCSTGCGFAIVPG